MFDNVHGIVQMTSGSQSRSQDLKGGECLIKLEEIYQEATSLGNVGAFIIRVDQIHLLT